MFKVVSLFLSISIFSVAQANETVEFETAQELLTVMEVDKQMLGGFEAMLPIVNQLADKLKLNAQETEELKGIYRDWFDNDIDRVKMRTEIANLYSKQFTMSEMKQIIEFYGTPIGKKLIQQSPELAKLGAQIGMAEAQNKQHLLVEKLTPFMEEHSSE
ncbi:MULTISPECIES: DUF2059 domain-containing protein [Vibrio]|uniref:DUF2059 domain-containing protein n=1 Tax=Vibrio TaxID=662 RepID=UPI000F4A45D1|nr:MULTISPECIES: DUF2059 domain-containing protein [Vibrio]NOH94923.1 DUF2059 domain-containing protein [Vibrio sp. AIC-3]ROP25605.1 hypothetical protein EDB33_101690 [Vibrio crassostreae]ROP26385.1 hypothetical protein EDB34_101690 [Vibrio crassostreae]RPF00954.1 hypothetical protein EDB15_101690 [Vibrio crassostreae]TCV28144.1 hypothetical protein EDB11_101690 [Vibrio crassostreae]